MEVRLNTLPQGVWVRVIRPHPSSAWPINRVKGLIGQHGPVDKLYISGMAPESPKEYGGCYVSADGKAIWCDCYVEQIEDPDGNY